MAMALLGTGADDLAEKGTANKGDKRPRGTKRDSAETLKPPPNKCSLALTSPFRGCA
jgi:hypothetical protein